jgi:preprotein translocase subunit SecG
MIGFFTIIHVLVCVLLVISILMQSSKGGGMAGVFGGGGSVGGVFGGRGAASFLSKVTLWFGVIFAVTTISIALLSVKSGSRPKSYLQEVVEKEKQVSPANMLPVVPQNPQPQPEKK